MIRQLGILSAVILICTLTVVIGLLHRIFISGGCKIKSWSSMFNLECYNKQTVKLTNWKTADGTIAHLASHERRR